MMMQRHVPALPYKHPCQHQPIPNHHLAVNLVVQLLPLHIFPRRILQLCLSAHFFKSPYNLTALSCKYPCASSSAFASLIAPSSTSSASAAANPVREVRAASHILSSAPNASLNGNASDPNIILSGYKVNNCFITTLNCDGYSISD